MNFFESKQNRIITVVCLTISVICLYFMQNDSLFRISRSGSNEAIGTFENLKKDVRKKNLVNYFWDDLKPKDILIEGDSIFTGVDSSVTVRLANGQAIIVAPNSLIKFSSKGKKLVLDIPYGGVQLEKVVDEFYVADCGENITLSKDSSAVSLKKHEKCGSVKIETDSIVNNRNFNERKIKNDMTNTFMEMAGSGILDKIERVFGATLSTPRLETTQIKYSANEFAPIVLKWDPVEGARNYTVEVSDNTDFDQIDRYFTSTPLYVLKKLSSNMYFRVKALGEGTEVSDFSDIGHLEVYFPSIKLNKTLLTKDYKAKNPQDRGIASTALDLNWSKVPYADRYVVELMDAQKNLIKRWATRDLASELNVPKTGKYSYQVYALDYKGRKISSSEVGELIYNKVLELLAPIIKQTANDRFYFFQKRSAKYIWLNWLGQGDVQSKFRVEIATDKEFSNIIQSSFTTKSKFLLTNQIKQGEYFWRVRSEEGDKFSEWSNVDNFKIQFNSK